MSGMLLSLRMWLVVKAMEDGATFKEAEYAVSETVQKWISADPNLRTYDEWQERYAGKEAKT